MRQASHHPLLSLTIGGTVAKFTITATARCRRAPWPALQSDVAVTGGTAPYRGTASQWDLAAGLVIDSATGAAQRNARRDGTFTIPVQVTDALKRRRQVLVGLTSRANAYTITTDFSFPLSHRDGREYRIAQHFRSGGTKPYSWSLSGDAGGLTLDAAPASLGQRAELGTFTFTVQVTDAAGLSASQNFALVVNPPTLSITIVAQPVNGTVGVPYNQKLPVVANGGTQPITWTLVSGAAPGWFFDPTSSI